MLKRSQEVYISTEIEISFRSIRFLLPMFGVSDLGFLQYLNGFLFGLHFRAFWLPAKAWTRRHAIASVHGHPFLSLRCRYVGVWRIMFGVIVKLVACFGGREVGTVFKGTSYGTLEIENDWEVTARCAKVRQLLINFHRTMEIDHTIRIHNC